MSVDTHKETLDFQTEAKQLLQLMIHSLYSNKEIFLRELISNASDACDKLRFEALTDDALYDGDGDLKVRVSFDKKQRTITVSDNGIGMNRQEVMDNVGTIAKSGTKQFFESLTGDQAKDANLIGQFGVGFYSAFIVAERVTINTRRAGLGAEHGVRWESEGAGSYTLETVNQARRGTEIILHLRADEKEFLDGMRLRHIIRKYSDSIDLPIVMTKETAGEEGKDAVVEDEVVNQASALWTRPRKEIKDEEYNEFYKHIGHDFQDPLTHVHTHVEGKQCYTSLLYVPQRAPFDLWDRDHRHGVKLYVKRIFIMDGAEQLMPSYLRFVRGVIDSDDLPLNVSREILQHNRQIDAIRGASVKKVLGLLEGLAKKDSDKYATFWSEFGRVMKEGVAEDNTNQQRIAALLRFSSTHDESAVQSVSLADYIGRMQEGQNKIYYITAETLSAAKNSPHLEVFRKKGIEVLLMHDRVDEWMMSYLHEFDEKSFQSVAKGDLELGGLEDQDEKQALEKDADELKSLTDRINEILTDKVKEVRVTHRLTESPACLVVEEDDMAINLQKMLKAAGQAVPMSKPILEINPQHPLVVNIKAEDNDDQFSDWANVLFDQALLSEGGQLDDPAAFVKRMNTLLLRLSA
jgi:molecular chaperone HtpG